MSTDRTLKIALKIVTVLFVVAAVLMLLTGCASKPVPTSYAIKCPAILSDLECRQCPQYQPIDLVKIEDQRARMLLAEAALKDCETINDACYRRDKVNTREWEQCDEGI